VACGSGNGWLDQWRRRARHTRPSGADRQRVGLESRHHQEPRRQAQALVTHAAQLAMVIMAIGLLGGGIQRRRLCLGFGQGQRHGPMAVMRSRRFGVLRRADRRQDGGVVRTAFRNGHPRARPQPQGHQAQQKAKEQSTHGQIISDRQSPCRAPSVQHLSEFGPARRHSKRPAPPCLPTGCAHGCPWPAPCPAPRPTGQSC
jgi:hypothetical protein